MSPFRRDLNVSYWRVSAAIIVDLRLDLRVAQTDRNNARGTAHFLRTSGSGQSTSKAWTPVNAVLYCRRASPRRADRGMTK